VAVALRPLVSLSWTTTLGSWRTLRAPGLLLIALLPTIVVVGLVVSGQTGAALVGTYEGLMQGAFFPLVLLIVTLLLAVPLFRDEIDDQSITFLLTRTINKPFTVAGKYVGYWVTANLVLLPPVALGYAIVASEAGSASSELVGVLPSLLLMTEVGLVAFGAIFLFLGLLTRKALIVGLVYAFFWEYLIGGLAGFAPDLSIMHYLLSIPTFWVPSGTLASYSTALTFDEAWGVPILVAIIVLALSVVLYWFAEINPPPE
jgi:ABC-2 type transport system permease protein